MDVSSSINVPAQIEKDPMKKALEVQGEQVLKVLEGLQEESQKIATHKTGIGNNLNVSA
ncbi:MAG: hypothetical protein L3I99_03310 [Sulfurimonas sp.]|nr:hypothetical protein [Sulfurimonas sp.]